ncbi:HAMP domain-containing protein [Candidatus Woesearchaeota archaeon]|nr:HAMP domain-containing protein [Candidatus Woesearchaeota archaeon]
MDMRRISIKWMMYSSLMIIAIISSIAGGIYSYHNAEQRLLESTTDYIESLGYSRSQHLKSFLEEQREKADIIAATTQIRDVLSHEGRDEEGSESSMDNALSMMRRSLHTEFSRIHVTDPEGIVIISTDKEIEGAKISDIIPYYDINDAGISHPYISRAGERFFSITVPVDKGTELEGFVIIDISMDHIGDIVSDAAGLRETGDVYLLDSKAIALTPLRHIEEPSIDHKVNTTNFRACRLHAYLPEAEIRARHEETRIIKDYRNVSVISTHYYIESADWCLLAEIDLEEALSIQRKDIILNVLYLFIFLMVFLSITSYLISSIISSPIKKISSKVEKIISGDFETEMGKSRIKEIQSLIDSLDRILASLKLAVMKVGVKKGEIGIGELVKAKEEAEENVRKKKQQLERFAKLAIGREKKMIELKKKLKETQARLDNKEPKKQSKKQSKKQQGNKKEQ